MQSIGGYVKTNKKGRIVHITEAYDMVMRFLNHNSEDEKKKEYRKRVIGNTALVSAPQEYYNLGIIKELGISISDWESYPIEHRAKLTAHHYLKIMIEVIDNHYREQEEEMKKIIPKGKSGG